MKRVAISSLLMALATMLPGSAAATETQSIVLSYGALPCGDFIAAPQSQQMYEAYALGFISGANLMDDSDMRFTGNSGSSNSVMLWLRNYCSQHPLDGFVTAVIGLRMELAKHEGHQPATRAN